MSRTDDKDELQRRYTRLRLQDLENEDPEILTAYTLCHDHDDLGRLLYAYYHLGDVRNATNHAVDEEGTFAVLLDDTDVGARMQMIVKTIENFIFMYDKVVGNMESCEKGIELVTSDEVMAYAMTLRPKYTKKDEH